MIAVTDIINDSWHIYIAASRPHRRVVGAEMVMAVELGTSPAPDSMLANCGNHSCTDTVYLDASIWRIGYAHFRNLRNSMPICCKFVQCPKTKYIEEALLLSFYTKYKYKILSISLDTSSVPCCFRYFVLSSFLLILRSHPYPLSIGCCLQYVETNAIPELVDGQEEILLLMLILCRVKRNSFSRIT